MAVPLLWSCTPSPWSFIICTHRTTRSMFTVHYSLSLAQSLLGSLTYCSRGEKTPEGYFTPRKVFFILEAFMAHLEVKFMERRFSFVKQLRRDTPLVRSLCSRCRWRRSQRACWRKNRASEASACNWKKNIKDKIKWNFNDLHGRNGSLKK